MYIKKSVIILHPADKSACAFFRCNAMATLINSAKGGDIEVIVSRAEINDEYILKYTAAVVFFRVTTEQQATMVMHYKRKKGKFGFKIFCDYDDLVFDVGKFKYLPSWNPNAETEDLVKNAETMKAALSDIDGITVTTEWLKGCMEARFGWKHVKVLPNALPRSYYGTGGTYKEFTDHVDLIDLKHPRVLYAGSTCHFSEGNPGDFAGPWIPWLHDAIKNDEIEYWAFQLPDFLEDVKDKVNLIEQCSCVEFPSIIAEVEPDFYIAPLADNFFNRAKSNLKLMEASAIGAVLIGSSFDYGPYQGALEVQLVKPGVTPEELKAKFEKLKDFDLWKDCRARQRAIMGLPDDKNTLWMESDHYIERWLRAYFGDTLQVNRE